MHMEQTRDQRTSRSSCNPCVPRSATRSIVLYFLTSSNPRWRNHIPLGLGCSTRLLKLTAIDT